VANPLDWSLIYGAVPTAVLVIGAIGLVFLVLRRRDGWWTWRVPLAVALAALTGWLVKLVVDDWWKPFADPLPDEVAAWIGVTVLAAALAVLGFSRTGWRYRIGLVLAVAAVLVMASSQVNRQFQQYVTLRAALGSLLPLHSADISKVEAGRDTAVTAPAGTALESVWRAPAGMPAKGELSQVSIPPTLSGFTARPAWIYLPPAALATPPARLPVLLLLAGQPGSPRDWIDAGQLPQMMDGYAAGHHGLAPIVVMADGTGSEFGNPMCLDSRLGKAQTYLTRDVPDWVRGHLAVAGDAQGWAVAGLSYGGTCSIQFVTNTADVFKSFIDISGQSEPTLGTRSETVQQAFGGDVAAFTAVNPVDIMARQKFPGTAGLVAVGTGDRMYGPEQRVVYAACLKAGMQVQLLLYPGGHSWQVWRPALQDNLDWLGKHTGLTG